MPVDTKPKRKVVERLDKTLIQTSPGKFVRMPQLHAKDKDIKITTKTYGPSGNLKKTKEEIQYIFEEGHGKVIGGKSISTSKYDKSGNVRKNVTIGFDKKISKTGSETENKKTVTKRGVTKEKNVRSGDIRRLNRMNVK